MSGGGKGGSTTTKVDIPDALKKAAKDNLKQAKQVSQLPYAPNFGPTVAAFTPQQQAAFDTANVGSSAFGLPTGDSSPLPAPTTAGGFKGYSTEPIYNASMDKVPSNVLALYNALFANPGASVGSKVATRPQPAAAPKATSPSGKGAGVFG
jgi:hypothetical protein